MLRSLLLLPVLLISYISFAQTVENIRVETEGEKIKIHYRIGGSTEAQLYRVTLTCSLDGGDRFEPKAVIGDVGMNIRGGKSYYTIVWDVFEDVDDVGSAEFFVKVEMMEDMTAPVTPIEVRPKKMHEESVKRQVEESDQGFKVEKPDETKESGEPDPYNNRFLLSYRASTYNLIGFTAGTLGNWGLYGSVRIGRYDQALELLSGSVTAGMTKHFFSAGKYRMHGYLGAGIGDYFNRFDLEAGITNVFFNRLTVTVGMEYPGYYADFVFGIGVVL
ncbi:MAG TPA: hypothetical protein ENO20_00265 [Bacteroides sp.]|nr:hypothetical protein [Bacteroides sp.]